MSFLLKGVVGDCAVVGAWQWSALPPSLPGRRTRLRPRNFA